MKKMKIALATALVSSSLFSTQVLSEARYSYTTDGTTPADVTARVQLKVVVPKIMVLKVGDFGDFGLSTTPNDEIKWTLGLKDDAATFADADADQLYAGVGGSIVPAAVSPIVVEDTDGSGGPLNDGILNVGVWGNVGDMSLNGAITTVFAETGGSTAVAPVLAEFTVAAGGTVAHPGANLGAFATSALVATDGVFNQTDTWTYTYSAATLPAAGTWTAVATYTLSSP